MIWGLRKDKRVRAEPKTKASCPICKGNLIANVEKLKYGIGHIKQKKSVIHLQNLKVIGT